MAAADLQVTDLSDDTLVLVACLALEAGLSKAALVDIAGAQRKKALEPLLSDGVDSGLLEEGKARTAPGARPEPGYRVVAWRAQSVLRAATERGLLIEAAQLTGRVLGTRSQAPPNVALQFADRKRFKQMVAAQRVHLGQSAKSEQEWLREHVCQPVDIDWLTATWGDEALSLAVDVLRGCVCGPHDTGGLEDWLGAEVETIDEPQLQVGLAAALAEHAALRGDVAALRAAGAYLPARHSAGYAIAAQLIEGDMAGATARLLDVTSGKKAQLPSWGVVTPILALLLCARGDKQGVTQAKRVMSVGTRPEERAATKALRTLLRYLDSPETEQRRIDVYAVARSGCAWELLLLGHTIQLNSDHDVTRAVWSQQITRRAAPWLSMGYDWLARQALMLARELDADYCREELLARGVELDIATELTGVGLWHGVTPKLEWQKALDRLVEVSEQLTGRVETSYRVAWFVDMSDGSLALPAVQSFREDLGSWTQGQRIDLAKLYEQREHLPEEDRQVLECTRELAPGRRLPTDELIERLIGHPRVFNGARGMLPVQVLSGQAQIETRDDAGYLEVVVEPRGAVKGVNVIVEAQDRLRVYRVTSEMAKVMAALPHGVRIPKAHEAEALQVLGKLSQAVEVRSPELGVETTLDADTTPCVRIAPHSGAWLVQLGVRPLGARGRFFIAGDGRERIKSYQDGRRVACVRPFQRERAAVEALARQCSRLAPVPEEDRDPRDPKDSWVFSEEALLDLLGELSQSDAPHSLEWPESTALRVAGTASSRSLSAQLRCIKGWYLASGRVKLDEINEVTLGQLVRAEPIGGGRYVRLPDGDYVQVEERVRRVMAALRGAAHARKRTAPEAGDPDEPLQVHRGALSTLRELAAPDSGFELDRDSAAWLERVDRLSERGFPVPADLQATLRDYQVRGYEWLCRLSELQLGACLADDMGLGKTLQIVAFLLGRGAVGPALIVAPTSVCGNWAAEIARFAPALRIVNYAGKGRAALLKSVPQNQPIVITSYALLQQDADQLAEIEWDTVVLDEAQFIKNATSQRARAAYRLSARFRIAATGTPVENHLGDLWSIFRFLNPGLLGDWKNFRRAFVRPIEQDDDDLARRELRSRVEGYVLRRLKRDVLTELPALTEIQHEVQWSRDEARRYAVLRKDIHEKLFTRAGRFDNKIEVLAEITRLRRFCCHPRLVFPDAELECSKIDAFLELVQELRTNGHRALVFSQFVDFLALVRDQLEEHGIDYVYLDGSTPQARRSARVEQFQQGDAPLFLISLKAGGFGLNLTAADYVIHLDPWWNPAVEAQATDRAHRIGQDRPVTVYRLLVRDSIEHNIVQLHTKKRRLAEALLEGTGRVAKLETEELVALLGDM